MLFFLSLILKTCNVRNVNVRMELANGNSLRNMKKWTAPLSNRMSWTSFLTKVCESSPSTVNPENKMPNTRPKHCIFLWRGRAKAMFKDQRVFSLCREVIRSSDNAST